MTRQHHLLAIRSQQHELAVALVAVVARLIAFSRRAALAAVIVNLERGDAVVEGQRSRTLLWYTDGIAVGGIAIYAECQRGSIVKFQVIVAVFVTEIFFATVAIPVI